MKQPATNYTVDSKSLNRDSEDDQSELESLRRLAHLLDDAIHLPGGIRIGLDGIVGLIPGVGDLIGTLMSSYFVAVAARSGVSTSTIAMMVYNIAVETVIGIIPVVGDIFDFAWKANSKNMALIDSYLLDPQRSSRANRKNLVGPLLVLLLVVGVAAALAITVVKLIIGIFS